MMHSKSLAHITLLGVLLMAGCTTDQQESAASSSDKITVIHGSKRLALAPQDARTLLDLVAAQEIATAPPGFLTLQRREAGEVSEVQIVLADLVENGGGPMNLELRAGDVVTLYPKT